MRYEINVQTGESVELPDLPLPAQEYIDAESDRASAIQAKRDAISENAENATVKYLTTHTAAEIATYIQKNVTDLASAKVMIARLAIAVGSMLR